MILSTYISLRAFIDGWNGDKTGRTFCLSAVNLMHTTGADNYGLELLRKSIGLYEQQLNISAENSKQAFPFFRNNRRMLVGPEVEMYIIPMYEEEALPLQMPNTNDVILKVSFSYEELAEYCLSNNLYLVRCKYNEEECLHTFVKQLEREYDKFFFDDEHTGFAADSRFYSMLCNACMEVKPSRQSAEKEWDIAVLCEPSEAEYDFLPGRGFTPFTRIPIPASSIRRINMLNRDDEMLSFSALAGFLEKKGLSPESYLDGLIEEE